MKQEINVDFINNTLKFICENLNDNNINYYVVGALGAYIDASLPLERIHEDIDIMIEEKYIDRLENIFKNTDFEFHDNRMSSNKVLNEYGYTDGDHEVYAKYKYNDFHIGFFLFHYDDNSYTITEYFNEKGIPKKLERTLPIEFFKLQYNDDWITYLGVKLKVVRKETIYKNKLVMNREKDLFDIKKLEPIIESNKLDKLNGLSKYRKTAIIDL